MPRDRNRAAGARDSALLALMYGCGLRRAEAAAVQMDDLDVDEGVVLVRGKGNRQRFAFIHNGAVDAVEAWIGFRGTDPGPLLSPVNKSGSVAVGRGVTGTAIAQRVNLRGRQGGLGVVSPHTLRRSYATELLRGGRLSALSPASWAMPDWIRPESTTGGVMTRPRRQRPRLPSPT